MPLAEEDVVGLQEIRALLNEFIGSDDGNNSKVVIKRYLVTTAEKDELLLPFLWGRKHRANYAWQTLKRNAEIRLQECPELFPEILPSNVVTYVSEQKLFGVLKVLDTKGRRVLIFNASAWDPDQCSLHDLTIIFIRIIENLLKDETCAKDGCIYIHHCTGVSLKQARQYSISAIRKLIKVFWHSYPIQLKSLYYVQVPSFLHYTFALAKPFFPKKLKERLMVTPVESGFGEIHKIISSNNLPEFLGGRLKLEESLDQTFCSF